MSFLKRILSSSGDRSLKYKRNSVFILLLQGVNIISSFLLVTVVLNVLGVQEYGVWVTITTIISWFSFIDVGLGHGLRNNYGIAKTKNDIHEINILVSTTFFTLIVISLALSVLLIPISYIINWSTILNAPLKLNQEIRTIMIYMIICFCLRSFLSIGLILKSADQDPYINNLIITSGNFLSLVYAFFIVRFGYASLESLGIGLAIFQVFPYLLSFIFLFSSVYKEYKPRFQNFSIDHLKIIYSLGIKFFLIQILNIVLLQSNILLIAHYVGQSFVTEYNIAYKYLWPLMIIFTAISIPMWSASTDAYFKGDYEWLKKSMKNLKLTVWGLSVLGIVAIIFSPLIYKIWLKGKIEVDYVLMALIFIYFISMMFYSMYRMFMNGVGKIKLQLRITLIQTLIHIPLAIFLCKYFTIYGVLICMILWNLINCVWEPIQFRKLLHNSAKGIWFK